MGQGQHQGLHLQSVLMAVIRDGTGAASGPSLTDCPYLPEEPTVCEA